MRPGRVVESLLIAFLLLIFEGGCSLSSSASHEGSALKTYAVMADSTPFYRHSPRQGGGPDQIVVQGTSVTLIRSAAEFCWVQLPRGEKGYVSRKDIAPAARVVAAATPEAPAGASSSAWRAELPQPRSITPPPALPEFEPTPFPETINPRN